MAKQKKQKLEIVQPETEPFAADSSEFLLRVAKYFVAVVMCSVAVSQMFQAHLLGLTTWKGGGFGLFASLDHLRFSTIMWRSNEWRQPLSRSGLYKKEMERFEALPLPTSGTRYARKIYDAAGQEPNTWVEVTVYDCDYKINWSGDCTLECKPILISDSRGNSRRF